MDRTVRKTFRLPAPAADQLADLAGRLPGCPDMSSIVRECIRTVWSQVFSKGGPIFELDRTADLIVAEVADGDLPASRPSDAKATRRLHGNKTKRVETTAHPQNKRPTK